MRKTIYVPPPADFASFGPSELFRYFFQIGHWTEDSFSDELQNYTRGTLVSTVTISKWKNRDVIPRRYSGPLFKLIENLTEPENATQWIRAFEIVWARHSSGRPRKTAEPKTQAVADTIKVQHQSWVHQLYTQNRKGDMFSPADIYIPIQLSDRQEKPPTPQDVEDIIERLDGTRNSDDKIDWVFVSGDPGAGKSMTALHMAHLTCDSDVFPIFIRGHRLSNIDIDIIDPKKMIEDAFSIRSFLKHFRASSFNRAILFMDGVDEIERDSSGTSDKLSEILSDLKKEQAACAAHNKNLKVIIFGRDTHIQFTKDEVRPSHALHLELLSLDGSPRNNGESVDATHGQDLREVWWRKYLAATNLVSDTTLPDFLTTEFDDFSEFGTNPLLSYLICQTALDNYGDNSLEKLPHELVNELTYSTNKNDIYQTILNHLFNKIQPAIDPRQFQTVLQHIALATWHDGNSRNTTLSSIYNQIRDPETKAAFQALSLSNTTNQTLPDILITAFYYRVSKGDAVSDKNLIEFTHKSFSEYLTSTLIFDRFVELVSAMETENGFESALQNWTELSHAGLHSPSLADFCQKEASLRYEAVSNHDWDLALKINRYYLKSHLFAGNGLSSLKAMQHSLNLLFFAWSCLNLERQKRTDTHFSLCDTQQGFGIDDLKSIQPPNALHFKSGSMLDPSLRDMTFLTPSLSALRLESADMSQLSFSLGHIENLMCNDTSFAMTYWSHVKITGSEFSRTVFQQTIFHHWQIINSRFSNCFFQGARFQGASFMDCQFRDTFFSQCHFSDVDFSRTYLENTIFDRCVFTNCDIPKHDERSTLSKWKFRHCTFMEMDDSLRNMPQEFIENPISMLTKEDQLTFFKHIEF